MRASIIIPIFKQREHLLAKCLERTAPQLTDEIEAIVVNDGPDTVGMAGLCKQYNARYIWMGRDENTAQWRVPSIANNAGVYHAQAEIIIIMGGDIYQVDDCVEKLVAEVERKPMAIVIPAGKDQGPHDDINDYYSMKNLRTELGFMMALCKEHYWAIGGYDEEFTGYNSDDRDFTQRLQRYGLRYSKLTDIRIIHQYHIRYDAEHIRLGSNKYRMEEMKHQLTRNQNGFQYQKLFKCG